MFPHATATIRTLQKKNKNITNAHHAAHAVLVLALRPTIKCMASRQHARALLISNHQEALPRIETLALGTSFRWPHAPVTEAPVTASGWLRLGSCEGEGEMGRSSAAFLEQLQDIKKKDIYMPRRSKSYIAHLSVRRRRATQHHNTLWRGAGTTGDAGGSGQSHNISDS